MSSIGSPVSARKPEQIVRDLNYLREHQICEKLEFLVRQVLREQPEDPILYICSQLRERCQSSSRSGSLRSSWNFTRDDDAVRQSGTKPSDTTASTPPPVDSGPNAHALAATPTTATDTPFAAAGSSLNHYPVPPQSANSTSAGGPLGGSLKTSRVTTPAAARPSTVPRGGALERDESVKSDQSVFSVASVDMQEFLSEFRSARNEFLGSGADCISRNDLAEIVDRVNLPLPDVRLIAELFDEMVAANSASAGHVPFEAFLARMSFKIQGRYPTEVLRGLFHYLALGGTWAVFAASQANAVDGTPRGGTAGQRSPGPATVLPRGGSASSLRGAPDAITPAASSGVPRNRVLDEGLRSGLGIRLTNAEVNRLLQQLGIPLDEDFSFQWTDFLALVHAATGQQREDDIL